MATAIESDPLEEALAAQSAKVKTMNNNEEMPLLSGDVIKAIETYLKYLKRFALPAKTAKAVSAIRAEFEASGTIRAMDLALLRRCFLRGRASRYEVDWLPLGVLDAAIAQELDGTPCRMLPNSEMEQAIRWLAIEGDHPDEVNAWHERIQDELILTGWLPPNELAKLKKKYLESMGRGVSLLQDGQKQR